MAVYFLGGYLASPFQGVLVAVLIAAAGLVLRRGWVKLFGPVLFYDLITAARRGRYVLLRCGYALALLLVLYTAYAGLGETGRMGRLTASDIARFGESFFSIFMLAQFAAVVLFTPAYCGGAIADEKDRQTLEYLLATDLRNREIVLSKLAARLANLGLLLFAGLPILSLTQLWGGVDPMLILAGFTAIGLTMLSIGSLSILQSVYARKPRDAIVLTYLVTVTYLGLSLLSRVLLGYPTLAATALTSGPSPVTVGDLVEWFNAGNLPVAVSKLRAAVAAGLALDAEVPGLLHTYTLFHGAVAVVCGAWAVARLRAAALVAPHRHAVRAGRRAWYRFRPRIGRDPVLWKEVFAEPGLTFTRFGRILVGLIVLASFIPAVWLGGQFVIDYWYPTPVNQPWLAVSRAYIWDQLGLAINQWVRVVGTLVACLTLVGVAVRAAGSISGERDRQTFDNLLTTPLATRTILFAKWLGSILSVRWAWLWLALIWLLGLATGGLDVVTVPWLFMAWLVYAGFLAVLGLWFSITSRTSLGATLGTLAAAGMAGGGHWLLSLLCLFPLALLTGPRDEYGWLVHALLFGLTPPVALSWLAFRGHDVQLPLVSIANEDPWGALGALVGGLVLYTAAAGLGWRWTDRRFRQLAGREAVARPKVSPAAAGASASPATPQARKVAPPNWRRSAWRVAYLTAVLLALGIGWYWYVSSQADERLQNAIGEANRLDPGWRLEELESRRHVVGPDNAALAVIQASALLPPYWRNHFFYLFDDRRGPSDGMTKEDLAKVQTWLARQTLALGIAGRLADLPDGRYEIAYSADGLSTTLDHLSYINNILDLLAVQARFQVETGDADGAVASCCGMLNACRALRDEPFARSQETRFAGLERAVRTLESILARDTPSTYSLIRIARLLEDDEPAPFLTAARGERAIQDLSLVALLDGKVSVQAFIDLAAYTPTGQPVDAQLRQRLRQELSWPTSCTHLRAAILQYSNQVVETAKLPDGVEQADRLRRLESALEQERPPWRVLVRGWTERLEAWQRGRANLRCARAAIAAERYRRAQGRWPQSLGTLVPELLAGVPTDPLTIRPLSYRMRHTVVAIRPSSIDSIDPRMPAFDKGAQLGLRLWPVAFRGSRPPSEERARGMAPRDFPKSDPPSRDSAPPAAASSAPR
jgi:ABC-type transport system involved in multi-copper enzyme maturation permease subunit